MKKKFWTSDKLVGLVAILISLTTLIIFVRQTNIMEKQSHLSVMPYLMVETTDQNPDNIFQITIVNYGVGPAIIDDVRILYAGRTYELDFLDFAERELPQLDSLNILQSSSIHKGLAIPAGGERIMLKVGGNEKDYLAFLGIMGHLLDNNFDYELKYRSIYGDQWKISESNDTPEALN